MGGDTCQISIIDSDGGVPLGLLGLSDPLALTCVPAKEIDKKLLQLFVNCSKTNKVKFLRFQLMIFQQYCFIFYSTNQVDIRKLLSSIIVDKNLI